MQTNRPADRILIYQTLGFVGIIILSWANEKLNLPFLFGAVQYIPNWRESVVETAIVLLIAVPLMFLTKRLISRLHYLESFVMICAWCRKLRLHGDWRPLEEFLESKFEVQTSHGMCPACYEQVHATIKKQPAA